MPRQTNQPKKASPTLPNSFNTYSNLWSGNKVYAWLGLLILLAGILRILYLGADPPRSLSWSLSPFTDEGAHALNAKNKLLFGRWQLDEWFRMGVSPFFTLLIYLAFKLFGLGYVVARSISVLAALGGLALIFLLLHRSSGAPAAILGGLLTATGYLWIMQNRLATEETTLAFILLLAVFFWTLKPARLYGAFLAGFLAVGAVFFVKLSGLFFLPVIPLEIARQYWLKENSDWKVFGLKPLFMFLGGGILAAAIWLVAVYIPFSKATMLMLTATSTQSAGGHPESVIDFAKNFMTLSTTDQLANRLFIPLFLTFLVLLQWCSKFKEKLRRATDLEFITLVWFLVGIAFLSGMNYRPIRYQMILLPAVFIFSGLFLGRLLNPEPIQTKLSVGPVNWLFRGMVVALLTYNLLWSIDHYLLTHPSLLSSFSSSPGVWGPQIAERLNNFNRYLPRVIIFSSLTIGVWLGVTHLRKNSPKSQSRFRSKPGLVFIILLASLGIDSNQYFTWAKNRTYSLVETSRDLKNLPTGSVVAGPWSGSITMEAPVRAVEMQNFCNTDSVLERYPVTHLAIFEGGWEHKFFAEKYPEVLQQSRIWKTFLLPPGRLHIVELSQKGQNAQ